MSDIMVSAIITTRNRLNLLKRAIESVKNQTFKNIECIVVSDGSTDGTDEYCSSIGGLIYISIPVSESQGGNYARNIGVQKAKGRYVAFLDDDDYWMPTKIEKQVAIAKEKQSGYIYCDGIIEQVNGDSVNYIEMCHSMRYQGDVRKKILTTIFSTTSEILMDRTLIIEAGLFDEKLWFWQEYELSIRMAQLTNFQCVGEKLLVYRKDESDKQRLTNKFEGWIDTVRYIYKKHRNLYETLNYKEKLCYYQFVLQEAIYRSRLSGLRMRSIYYRIILGLLCVPQRMKKLLFNGTQ